jgi:hypothetical protein
MMDRVRRWRRRRRRRRRRRKYLSTLFFTAKPGRGSNPTQQMSFKR